MLGWCQLSWCNRLLRNRASDVSNRHRFVARTAKLITVIDDWASPRFHKRIMVHHLGPIPFGTSVWKPSAGRGWGRYRVTNVIVGEALRRERERGWEMREEGRWRGFETDGRNPCRPHRRFPPVRTTVLDPSILTLSLGDRTRTRQPSR